MLIPPPSRPPVRMPMPADAPSSPVAAPKARPAGQAAAPAHAGGAAGADARTAARARIAFIKERIAALRQLLLMFGGKVSASVLQELRQLAGELKAAAAVLASGSGDATAAAATPAPGGSAGDASDAPSHDGIDTEHVDAARAAYAEQAHADDTAAAAPVPGSTSARMEKISQRDQDERLVASAWQALRSAQAMARQIEERRRAGLPVE